MSTFHANDLHREFVSSFQGIRWGLVQIAGRIFMVRYWMTIIRWSDYWRYNSQPVQSWMPTSEVSMSTSEVSMPTEELIPTSG